MKKSRSWMVQMHLILAALFLPLMFMMPVSGALYLLDWKGDQSKEAVFAVEGSVPEGKAEQEAFFAEQFKKQGVDFDFEYIKATSTEYIFRPSSRVHYMAAPADGKLMMYKLNPSFIKRMMEVHKGHGPRLVRNLEIAFGISLLLVALSGVWIAIVTPIYRRAMLISFVVGLVALGFGFF